MNVFTAPYRLPDGRTARVNFDEGDHVPAAVTYTLAGGRVVLVDRIEPPTVMFWTGTQAVRP